MPDDRNSFTLYQGTQPEPVYKYAKPSSIDTPTQGNLHSHRERKKALHVSLKRLRAMMRAETSSVKRGLLKLEILKAEESYRQAIVGEKTCLALIEKRANELGLTTIKPKD